MAGKKIWQWKGKYKKITRQSFRRLNVNEKCVFFVFFFFPLCERLSWTLRPFLKLSPDLSIFFVLTNDLVKEKNKIPANAPQWRHQHFVMLEITSAVTCERSFVKSPQIQTSKRRRKKRGDNKNTFLVVFKRIDTWSSYFFFSFIFFPFSSSCLWFSRKWHNFMNSLKVHCVKCRDTYWWGSSL